MNVFESGISVIVPAYNAADYIAECLRSIMGSGFPKLEIIVIDDGSADNTYDVVKRIDDVRIVAVRQRNQGVSVARNKGLEIATNEWVTFVDADDLVTAHVYDAIKRLPDTGADIMQFNYVKSRQRESVICETEGAAIPPVICDDKLRLMKNALGFVGERDQMACPLRCVWGNFYKLSVIRHYGICFPKGVKNGEDRIFNLRYLDAASRVAYFNVPFYVYYQNPHSLTHRFKLDIREITTAFFDSLAPIVTEHPELMPQYQASLANNFFLEMNQYLFHPQNGMTRNECWQYFKSILKEHYDSALNAKTYSLGNKLETTIHLFLLRHSLKRTSFALFLVKRTIKKLLYGCNK